MKKKQITWKSVYNKTVDVVLPATKQDAKSGFSIAFFNKDGVEIPPIHAAIYDKETKKWTYYS